MTASLFRNYIAGEWVAGATTTINRNPSDRSDVIGEYAQADAAQTRAAVAAARAAFPAWATGPVQERANILERAATEILARKDELGRLLSREEGKTLPEGIGEAMRAGTSSGSSPARCCGWRARSSRRCARASTSR